MYINNRILVFFLFLFNNQVSNASGFDIASNEENLYENVEEASKELQQSTAWIIKMSEIVVALRAKGLNEDAEHVSSLMNVAIAPMRAASQTFSDLEVQLTHSLFLAKRLYGSLSDSTSTYLNVLDGSSNQNRSASPVEYNTESSVSTNSNRSTPVPTSARSKSPSSSKEDCFMGGSLMSHPPSPRKGVELFASEYTLISSKEDCSNPPSPRKNVELFALESTLVSSKCSECINFHRTQLFSRELSLVSPSSSQSDFVSYEDPKKPQSCNADNDPILQPCNANNDPTSPTESMGHSDKSSPFASSISRKCPSSEALDILDQLVMSVKKPVSLFEAGSSSDINISSSSSQSDLANNPTSPTESMGHSDKSSPTASAISRKCPSSEALDILGQLVMSVKKPVPLFEAGSSSDINGINKSPTPPAAPRLKAQNYKIEHQSMLDKEKEKKEVDFGPSINIKDCRNNAIELLDPRINNDQIEKKALNNLKKLNHIQSFPIISIQDLENQDDLKNIRIVFDPNKHGNYIINILEGKKVILNENIKSIIKDYKCHGCALSIVVEDYNGMDRAFVVEAEIHQFIHQFLDLFSKFDSEDLDNFLSLSIQGIKFNEPKQNFGVSGVDLSNIWKSGVVRVELKGNEMSSLPNHSFKDGVITKIMELVISNNKIDNPNMSWSDFTGSSIRRFKYVYLLDMSNNGFSGGLANVIRKDILKNVIHCDLSNNKISKSSAINDYGLLQTLNLQNNPKINDSGKLPYCVLNAANENQDLNGVEYIDLSNCGINSLQSTGNTLINKNKIILDLSDNKIDNLYDLANLFPYAHGIVLNNNNLYGLVDFTHFYNLEFIMIDNNKIEQLNLPECIKWVSAKNNQISTNGIDHINRLKNLNMVDFEGNIYSPNFEANVDFRIIPKKTYINDNDGIFDLSRHINENVPKAEDCLIEKKN